MWKGEEVMQEEVVVKWWCISTGKSRGKSPSKSQSARHVLYNRTRTTSTRYLDLHECIYYVQCLYP